MMRIKLYLGSQELEKYLNKKVHHNYILETIIPFGLFQPLRLDVLKFKKKKDLQRIYIVDSNDLVLIKRKYQNLGWQYFENNYANDEFNNDAIFYYDSIISNGGKVYEYFFTGVNYGTGLCGPHRNAELICH